MMEFRLNTEPGLNSTELYNLKFDHLKLKMFCKHPEIVKKIILWQMLKETVEMIS